MGGMLSKQGKQGKRDASKTSKKRSGFIAPVRLENVRRGSGLKWGRSMRNRESAMMRGEAGDAATAADTAAATPTATRVSEPMTQDAVDDGNGLAQDMATMSMTGTQDTERVKATDTEEPNTIGSEQSGGIGLTGAMAEMSISGQADISRVKRNRDDESDTLSSDHSGGISLSQGILEGDSETEKAGGETTKTKRVKRMHSGDMDSDTLDSERSGRIGLSEEDQVSMSTTRETKRIEGKGVAERTTDDPQPRNGIDVSSTDNNMSNTSNPAPERALIHQIVYHSAMEHSFHLHGTGFTNDSYLISLAHSLNANPLVDTQPWIITPSRIQNESIFEELDEGPGELKNENMTTVGLYNALTETKDIVDAKEEFLEAEKQKRIQKEKAHQDRRLDAELDAIYEEMRRDAEMKMGGLKVEEENAEEKKVEEKKKKTGWTGPDIMVGDTKMGETVRGSLEEGDRKLREGIKRDAETRRKFMGWEKRGAIDADRVKQQGWGMIAGDETVHWGSFQMWDEQKLARAKMEQEALWRDAKGE